MMYVIPNRNPYATIVSCNSASDARDEKVIIIYYNEYLIE